MTRSAYKGPDVRDPQQRREAFAGLTQRLAERRRVFLPLIRVPQVKDVRK